jgi:predicted hotdog family 3-hydroxylacyl-ACP dehydratase
VKLDRLWIAAHIPHQGRMCLLDEVLAWDARTIRCRSGSHRAPDHPLRAHDRLGSACGIEYAAQGMAVHAALCAGAGTEPGGSPPPGGRLTSVRAVNLHVTRLDDLESDLLVTAERQGEESGLVVYHFSLASIDDAARLLLEGRAAVLLQAGVAAGCGRGQR